MSGNLCFLILQWEIAVHELTIKLSVSNLSFITSHDHFVFLFAIQRTFKFFMISLYVVNQLLSIAHTLLCPFCPLNLYILPFKAFLYYTFY